MALDASVLELLDLTKVPGGTQDFTILGFSIGKFGLSLSNFSLHNLTDIGYKNKNYYFKLKKKYLYINFTFNFSQAPYIEA